VVREGVNGFFAATEEEWVENLERFSWQSRSDLIVGSHHARL